MKNKIIDWIQSITCNSNKKIQIYDGKDVIGNKEVMDLGINKESVLGNIVLYTAGICIDDWIRLIGQKNNNHKGISYYNKNHNSLLFGMIIIAQDVIGGIYAIDNNRFNSNGSIWYFAPDTLEWEDLEMNYVQFIAWILKGDTDDFYSDLRWKEWKDDCKNIDFDYVFLIYPFLWAKECNLMTANKIVVPFSELLDLNLKNANLLN